MSVANMNRILRAREAQYGRMGQESPFEESQEEEQQTGEEALKLFFDYIEKSNNQIMATCTTILNNQKIFEQKLDEINKKLENAKI